MRKCPIPRIYFWYIPIDGTMSSGINAIILFKDILGNKSADVTPNQVYNTVSEKNKQAQILCKHLTIGWLEIAELIGCIHTNGKIKISLKHPPQLFKIKWEMLHIFRH